MLSTGCPALAGVDHEYAVNEAGVSNETSTDGPTADGPPADGRAHDAKAGVDSPHDVVQPDVPPPSTCKSMATVCVEAAPPTWTGPIEIYDGDPTTAPKSCPSPLLLGITAYDGIVSADPVGCAACGCALGAITCGASTVTGYGDYTCGGCLGGSGAVPLGKCVNVGFSCLGYYVQSLSFGAPPATATCTPNGGSVTSTPPVVWKSAVVGCEAASSALQQVDCNAGQVCAPSTTPPFGPSLCVFKDGNVACPGAPYSKRSVAYSGAADTRDCTPCTCAVTAGTCTGKAAGYSDPSCSMSQTLNTAFGGCGEVTGSSIYASISSETPPTTLACPVDGGQPSGNAEPTSPVTICCL